MWLLTDINVALVVGCPSDLSARRPGLTDPRSKRVPAACLKSVQAELVHAGDRPAAR